MPSKNWNWICFLLFLVVILLIGLALLGKEKISPISLPIVSSPTVSEVTKETKTEEKEEEVKKKEEKKKKAKKQEVKKIKKVVRKIVKRDAAGWLPVTRLNVSPYRPYHTQKNDREVLTKMGYAEEEIVEYLELHKGRGEQVLISRGEKFLWMAFGKGRVLKKLKATWNGTKPGVLYRLKTGRNVVIMKECGNLTELPPRPVPAVPPVVEKPRPTVVVKVEIPPVVEAPPLTLEAPLVIEKKPQLPVVVVPPITMEAVVEKEKKCQADPNVFVGHEREPRHGGGDRMEATDLTAAFYCLQGEDPDITHGLGINFKGSWFEGRVNSGAGKFTGYLLAGGPAYKRIKEDEWDMEIRLLFGVLHERFRQGGYRNHRKNWIVGPSFIFNDYRRFSEGHRWFHETQWYIEILFPFASDLSHSFNGKSLSGEPDNLNFRLFVGVKEWWYDNEWVQPYFSGGIFWEDPLAMSATLRLGVALPNRCFGVGIGPDFDLKNGGTWFGWGPWLDGTTCLRDWRARYRRASLDVIGGGVTVSPDGFIMVPTGKRNTSTTVSPDGFIMVPTSRDEGNADVKNKGNDNM